MNFSNRLRSQYAFLAADSLARYSEPGVSHSARLAKYSGDVKVSVSLAFRCASATGSDIFSRLFSCALRMPSTRRFLISGSEFKILWYSLIGFAGFSKSSRFFFKTSCLGLKTPSPPSVKLARVPPSEILLKCAIRDRSIAHASSQDSLKNLWTRTFSAPYFAIKRMQWEFRSLCLARAGFHRLDVLPMPT